MKKKLLSLIPYSKIIFSWIGITLMTMGVLLGIINKSLGIYIMGIGISVYLLATANRPIYVELVAPNMNDDEEIPESPRTGYL